MSQNSLVFLKSYSLFKQIVFDEKLKYLRIFGSKDLLFFLNSKDRKTLAAFFLTLKLNL